MKKQLEGAEGGGSGSNRLPPFLIARDTIRVIRAYAQIDLSLDVDVVVVDSSPRFLERLDDLRCKNLLRK